MTRQNQIDAWWEHKSKVYPFECKIKYTDMGLGVNNTSMFNETGLDFVTHEGKEHRLFRFLTQADLLTFQKRYGATTS